MGHRRFAEIVGDINPERRARIDAIKQEARADAVAFNLAELRRHRELTQVELAERLEKAQASISAMEAAADNLLSTWRSVVESMGGRLELVAVFDDERITPPTGVDTRFTGGSDPDPASRPDVQRQRPRRPVLAAESGRRRGIARSPRTPSGGRTCWDMTSISP